MRRGCAAATPRGREPPRKCRTRPFLVYCAGTRLCIANLAATKHIYSELWPGPPWAYQQKHTRFGDMRAETDRHGQAKSNPSPFALGNHLNPARGLNKLVPNQTSCCCLPAPQQIQVHSSPAHPSPRLSKQTTVRYNPTKDKTSCVQPPAGDKNRVCSRNPCQHQRVHTPQTHTFYSKAPADMAHALPPVSEAPAQGSLLFFAPETSRMVPCRERQPPDPTPPTK